MTTDFIYHGNVAQEPMQMIRFFFKYYLNHNIYISSFCKLCLTEKLFILNTLGDDNCLNKKTEFINKCRHQNKLLLKNVKDSMD